MGKFLALHIQRNEYVLFFSHPYCAVPCRPSTQFVRSHCGANPPYAVLESLVYEIQKQEPEFILWGGDFTSHFEPGMAIGDTCRTAKISAMSTVTILGNAATAKPIQNLFVWGNNDVSVKWMELCDVTS